MAPPLDFNATLAEQLRDAGMQMRAMTKPQKQRVTPDATQDAPAGPAAEGALAQHAGQDAGTEDAGQHTDKTLGKALGKALAEATAAEAHAQDAASATAGATAHGSVTDARGHSHEAARGSHEDDAASRHREDDSHGPNSDRHAPDANSRRDSTATAETTAKASEAVTQDATASHAAAQADAVTVSHTEAVTPHSTAAHTNDSQAHKAVTATPTVATTASSTAEVTAHSTGDSTDKTTGDSTGNASVDATGDASAEATAHATDGGTVLATDVAQADSLAHSDVSSPLYSDRHSDAGSPAHSHASSTPHSHDLGGLQRDSHATDLDSHGAHSDSHGAEHDLRDMHGDSHGAEQDGQSVYSNGHGLHAPSSHAFQEHLPAEAAPSLPDAASELWAMSHHSEAPTLSERSWTGGVRGAVLDALRGLAGGRDHVLVNLKRLATHTGISYGSVRNAMSRLTRSGDIRTRQIRMADGHGVRVEFLTLPGQEGTGVATQGMASQAAVLGQAAMLAQNALQNQNTLHGQTFMTSSHAQAAQQAAQQAAHDYHLATQGAAFSGVSGAGQNAYGNPYAQTLPGETGAAEHMAVPFAGPATDRMTGQEAVGVTDPYLAHTATMHNTAPLTHGAVHGIVHGAVGEGVTMTAEHMMTTASHTPTASLGAPAAPLGGNAAQQPMSPAPHFMNASPQTIGASPQGMTAPQPLYAPAHTASFWDTADSLFGVAWPHVAAAGLGMEHLRALAPIFTVQGFDPAVLPRTLRYLDWELEAIGMPEDLPEAPAALPASVAEAARQLTQSYLRAMQRRGTWPRPAGYEEGDD